MVTQALVSYCCVSISAEKDFSASGYFSLIALYYTIRNFNGKPDFVGCLLVKNGLWPADFSIMYTYYWYKMFKITVHCREVSGPESVFNQ